jgi:hypothetical protein
MTPDESGMPAKATLPATTSSALAPTALVPSRLTTSRRIVANRSTIFLSIPCKGETV